MCYTSKVEHPVAPVLWCNVKVSNSRLPAIQRTELSQDSQLRLASLLLSTQNPSVFFAALCVESTLDYTGLGRCSLQTADYPLAYAEPSLLHAYDTVYKLAKNQNQKLVEFPETKCKRALSFIFSQLPVVKRAQIMSSLAYTQESDLVEKFVKIINPASSTLDVAVFSNWMLQIKRKALDLPVRDPIWLNLHGPQAGGKSQIVRILSQPFAAFRRAAGVAACLDERQVPTF